VLPLGVRNPNGLEEVDGTAFFWVGGPETRIDVVTGAAGVVTVRATTTLGPSVENAPDRRIHVATDHGCSQDVVAREGRSTWTLPVPAGRTSISLLDVDQPSRGVLPNGDTRPLLLGVRDVQLSFQGASGQGGAEALCLSVIGGFSLPR
jgi:hypothetical protein